MHVSGKLRANVTPNPYNSGHTAGRHRSTIERANVPLGLAVMTRLFTFLLGPRPQLGTEKGVLSLTQSKMRPIKLKETGEKGLNRNSDCENLRRPGGGARRAAARSGGERKGSAGRQGPRVAHKWLRQVAVPGPALPGRGACGIKAAGQGRARELRGTGGESVGAQGPCRRQGPGKRTRQPREVQRGSSRGTRDSEAEKTTLDPENPSRSRLET